MADGCDTRFDPDCRHGRPISLRLKHGGWCLWYTIEEAECLLAELQETIQMAKGKSQISGQAAGPSKRQQKIGKKKPRAVQIGERVVKAIDSLNPFD